MDREHGELRVAETVEAETIELETASPFTLRALERPNRRPQALRSRALLFRPPPRFRKFWRKPSPAVVILHGLGGVLETREVAYGRKLAAAGYVCLVLDAFPPRGAGTHWHWWRALTVTESMMLADSFAALRFLRTRPEVDPDRIAILGFSYGGMISVFSAQEQVRRVFAQGDARFAAHISYYGCTVARFDAPQTTGAPVLMQLGELDANVCIRRAERIAADLERGGSRVDLRVHANAYHQWDGPDIVKRHVGTNLAALRLRVRPDSEVYDPRTRLTMRGPLSRSAVLIAGVDLAGYDILRNEAVRERSDQALLSFLEGAFKADSVAAASAGPSVGRARP